MLDLLQNTKINSDFSEDDMPPGSYRDALNMSLIADGLGAFSKGTTYGNIDTNVTLKGLNPDAICLGTAIDAAGRRSIITFYQNVPVPPTPEYESVINYALSRGYQVPSPQVQVAQNLLISLLKQNGIWVGLDVFFCFYGDGDVNFARINWKTPNDATRLDVYGMIYQPNYGFKGNGASYLDTKYIPSIGVKYTNADAGVAIGYEEIILNAGAADGADSGVNKLIVAPYTALNTIDFAVNSNLPSVITDGQIVDNSGIVFVSRFNAGNQAVRKNVSDSFPIANAMSARPTVSVFLGATNISGVPGLYSSNRYSLFAAGENLNTFDREIKFYKDWITYKNSFVTPLITEGYVQEVLMYLVQGPIGGVVSPLLKSSSLLVNERSYLDGYSFVNDLFYFNFRDSAPKVINIQRATDSPGFYDNLSDTSLTIIKPHPPYAPIPARAIGTVPNSPIQKKPFQFMMVYNFMDGEQSTKSPASIYLNSLDDPAETITTLYDHIDITMVFPLKDYSIVEKIELFVRNNNNIADWRSVALIDRSSFVQAGSNYQHVLRFEDNVVGNFYPIELGVKINDAIPQQSNYLAFIESRIFMIDSLLDYDYTTTFQIKIDLDDNSLNPLPDDRLTFISTGDYKLTEFEYDSEYTIGLSFYDKYGRKYPSTASDRKLVTPVFAPVALPAGADTLPDQRVHAQLKKPKITAKYDLRAAGNIVNYGKPPSFAYWWGMIRGKNTKWEFQQSIQCLLRFPYNITKWTGTDPADFPDANGGNTNLFLEDGYLYWDPAKLLVLGGNLTKNLINDYIDVVIPPNFPYPLDSTVLIDFMLKVCSDVNATKLEITNREVVEVFANKIRIRGDRAARWFSNDAAGLGQYRAFPKFTTGVFLNASKTLFRDETYFPVIIKRRRQNNLENIILYDTPNVYPVNNPGTRVALFQQGQTANIVRALYPPNFIAPELARTLAQGDIVIQPLFLTPTTVATNHSIKITWGPNVGDSLRLRIKVSIWQLNDLMQPILELYSATEDEGGAYYVLNGETAEYLISRDAELINGWYGYGIQILTASSSNAQFLNPDFDDQTLNQIDDWLQSIEGLPNLRWKAGSSGEENYAWVDVSTMLGGWSKTLYQYLHKVLKSELTIAVTIEGINFIGPLVNAPVTQYPGDAQTPVIPDAVEQVYDLSRNIVPYYIDCSGDRVVTMNTLNFKMATPSPLNTFVRAEIWRVDQDTHKPVSLIAGSEGAWTALTGIPGPQNAPFGANKVIDQTGWYGIALYVDLPTFSNFINSDYGNGLSNWVVTGSPPGSPPWVFQPDTQQPPVYQQLVFAPPLGSDLGYQPIVTKLLMGTPIFIPVGLDPTGYDQVEIYIDWGNNSIYDNGWVGQPITVAMWEVDQGTKKPLTFDPTYSNITDIRSNGGSYHSITGNKILGNKWYQFGLGNHYGHGHTHQLQFQNSSFTGSIASWNVYPGVAGLSWVYGNGTIRCNNIPVGAFDTGFFYQVFGEGYLTACISTISLVPNNFTQIIAHLWIGEGPTPVESIDITSLIYGGPYGSGAVKSVVFSPKWAGDGQNVWFQFTGTCAVAASSISVYGVINSFNPYLEASPKIRFANVNVVNSPNESYRNFGSAGVLDPLWLNTYLFWKKSLHGQSAGDVTVIFRDYEYVGRAWNSLLFSIFSANGATPLYYAEINLTDLNGVSFNLQTEVIYDSTSGTLHLEVWAFDDPNNFTAGVKVLDIPYNGFTNVPVLVTYPAVIVPAGSKYVGYRVTGVGNSFGTVEWRDATWYPAIGFNSWEKTGSTADLRARLRDLSVPTGFILANFHADNIAPGTHSVNLGQYNITGTAVRVNIELFTGEAVNNYTLFLYDSNGSNLGSVAVVGQALGANPQITVNATIPATTTGLFFGIRNDNAIGTALLSARARQITNVNAPVTIEAGTGTANAKTWLLDGDNYAVELGTTSFTDVSATDDVPQPANDVTVVLADSAGVEISAQQTFNPNNGPVTLQFAPTLQADLNYNYGIKVRNNPVNSQIDGTIKILSVYNVASNDGIANIIAHTINPGQPLYEAWNQFSLGAFARAGYVTNFIAAVDDIQVSPFTPIAIDPTSYHLVANVVQSGIEDHSGNYGVPPVDSTYNYGPVYPSASSDPDAAGIVYEQKVGQSIGDVNAKNTDVGERSQSNIVRWSDPVIVGTKTNNLNSFGDGNKYSVDFQRGAIQVMIAMNDHTLFCVHEQGMSSLYVQRATMISPSEVQGQGDELFLTNKVIGNDNKLTSNVGTINPESCVVVESGTIAYGFDLVRKSLWQKTNNGVRNLTYECNAKQFFNRVCNYRLRAFQEGEDIKIYVGYNEKEKSLYITFAPFVFRGRIYPATTIAYNAYIDGFLSRYSFEPISYLVTEDVIHTIKAREFNNPDFFGRFEFWLTNDSTGTADWFRSTDSLSHAQANTLVPPGTRILNPDFSQGPTFWTTYGLGSAWLFVNDGCESTIPAGTFSRDIVNTSGALGTFLIRVSAQLPVAGLVVTINAYDLAGNVVEQLSANTPMTGNDVIQVTQNFPGRIGLLIENTTGAPITVHLNLFSTVVKTYLLYQPIPVIKEDLRIRIIVPERQGSMNIFVYAFNDPEAPFMSLLQEINLIGNKSQFAFTINVPNPATAKYVGLYTVTDYDVTLLRYFNVNSVPSIWAHNQIGKTNNFFGVQYDSGIELVFNVKAGQVRIFNSLGIMSEDAWSVESFTTSEGQISMLERENFRLRDGIYSAAIMRDVQTPQAALPDPVNNVPIVHGSKLCGVWLKIILRNNNTLKQVELRAVYLGSDELSGNLLAKK